MTEAPARGLGAFALVRQSVALFFDGFNFLFTLAFVPAFAVGAITALIVRPSADGAGPPGAALLAASLVQLPVFFLVWGVASLAAIDVLTGRRRAVGDYVGQTIGQLGPLFVLGSVVGVAAGLGLILLVVPGIYVLARFTPLVPVVLFEERRWSSMRRTSALTQGYRAPIMGATLLYMLALVLLGMLVGGLFAASEGVLGIGLQVPLEAASNALGYAFGGVFTAVVYARLRALKDGASLADIAAEAGPPPAPS